MDGWDYGPGNIGDGTGGGINWSGFGGTLTDLAKVWGAVEVADRKSTPYYAIGPNGRPYIEGQTAAAGGNNLLLLLVIVGVAVFALKD